jgi:murein DD-endopeptidase MepM/ murein hydrolase activator NlpD
LAPTRLNREQKKAATRQALLDAATEVFARHGFERAPLEEICDQAGYSRGAFYSNFSSKQQLFMEVLERRTADILAHIATAFADGDTPEQRLDRGARTVEAVLEDDRLWCQLHFEGWVLASRDEDFRALYAQRSSTHASEAGPHRADGERTSRRGTDEVPPGKFRCRASAASRVAGNVRQPAEPTGSVHVPPADEEVDDRRATRWDGVTAAMGAVGVHGVATGPPPAPATTAPPEATTFGQTLAAAMAATGPAVPATAPGAAPSITLGQMIRLASSPLALAPAPTAPSTAPVDASRSPVPSGDGMVRPAEGRISSEFGPRVHPVTGKNRPHTGIDVAAPVGAPIRAAAAGTVTFAGVRGGYGNLIIIDHGGGRETSYAHNSANAVSAGDRVSAGARIGAVGATGQVTGPHLHFEVRIDGTAVQPRDHVQF